MQLRIVLLLFIHSFIFIEAGVDNQYAMRVGGPNSDMINGIVVDKLNNAYTVGSFCGPEVSVFGGYNYTEIAQKCDGFVTKFSPDGNVVWNMVITGDRDESVTNIAIDTSNYIYILGYFTSNSIRIPSAIRPQSSEGYYNLYNQDFSNLTSDIFVAKMDLQGNVQWVKSGGGVGNELSSGIATDYLGNVFITGSFNSPKVTFGSVVSNNNTRFSGFLVKFEFGGEAVWMEQIGGVSSDDYSYGLAVDASGNPIVVGTFQSYVSQFGNITIKNLGGVSSYVMKAYSRGSEHSVQWALSLGGMDVDVATAVQCDSQSNIWVTGYFRSTIALFGTIYLLNLSPNGNSNIFLIKMDTYGTVLWGKSLGGVNSDTAQSLAIDANNNIYIIGTFTSSIAYFSEAKPLNTVGKSNIFLTKCDANGIFQWALSVGGVNQDNATSIAVGSQNTIVIAGFSNSPVISFQGRNLTIDSSRNASTTDGFIAVFKEINPCSSNPCVHGLCQMRGNEFGCLCMQGYSGSLCQTKIIHTCASNPCMNNGVCLEGSGSFICKCIAPYGDTLCQTDLSPPPKQTSIGVAVGVAIGVIFFIFLCAFFITRSAEAEKRYEFVE